MNLREKYGKKYRIFRDDSYEYDDTESRKQEWRYQEIRGKYGFIYPYSAKQLAVWLTGAYIVGGTKRKHKHWTKYVEGEGEAIFLFPEEDFRIAANLIKAKKKRKLSDEQLAKLRERLKKARAKKS